MSELVNRKNLSEDFQKFIDVAENEGWAVNLFDSKDNVDVELYKCSPQGQDFGIQLEINKNAEYDEISNALWDYYDGFDVSYETYLWLDDSGHGKNGAPYDMKVLYEDMEACEQMIRDLYDTY